MLSLTLPEPPSTNMLFRNVRGRGRVRTKKYSDWQDQAYIALATNRAPRRPIKGEYEVYIALHNKIRGDIDNRIKAVLDFLVRHKLTPDDRYVSKIHIERREEVSAGTCEVKAFVYNP